MKNAVNWFEIPVKNFDRAKTFYEALYQAEMSVSELPDFKIKMAFFPSDMELGAIGGSIVKGPNYKPSKIGALVYLNGGDDLSVILARVEESGGEIVMQKTSLGSNGFMAQFLDTEGNKLALHSRA